MTNVELSISVQKYDIFLGITKEILHLFFDK